MSVELDAQATRLAAQLAARLAALAGQARAGWMSNFRRLVLGCIDSYDSEQRRIFQDYFFQNLQDLHSVTSLQSQNFSKNQHKFDANLQTFRD